MVVKQKKLELNENFERVIVKSLVKNDPAFIVWIPHLKSAYFSSSALAYLFRRVQSFWQVSEGLIPTMPMLEQMIRTDSSLGKSEQRIYDNMLMRLNLTILFKSEKTYVLDVLERFVKHQKYILAMDRGIDLLERGDITSLDQSFADILKIGQLVSHSEGSKYFRDIKSRRFDLTERTSHYRLLIPELDRILRHGGMRRGESMFWLAPPGTGKTMALVHTTKAWMIQRLKGIYYTLQLPERDIAERLDSSLSGIPIKNLLTEYSEVSEKVKKAGKRYGDSLTIKFFPRHRTTIEDIREHFDRVSESSGKPDYIIIDFLNYMRAAGSAFQDNKGSRYYEGGDTAGEFVSFCQQEDILGAAGIQANRSALSSDVTTIDDVAESFASIFEATLVVSINRKTEERELETARLFIAKYTYGDDHLVIPINTNYKTGSLYRRI